MRSFAGVRPDWKVPISACCVSITNLPKHGQPNREITAVRPLVGTASGCYQARRWEVAGQGKYVLKSWIMRRLDARMRTRFLNRYPLGVDLNHDLQQLSAQHVGTVFDVGANVGQSAQQYRKTWPDAVIHSFEPVMSTFEKLKGAFAGDQRVVPHRIALSKEAGEGQMILAGKHDMHYLDRGLSSQSERGAAETVPLTTLDAFCKGEGISHINFLKIDTEGADMDVLLGAEKMLSSQSIDIIQVEAGLHPDNQRHVPFESFKSHLEGFGYRLFGIYDQYPDRYSGLPIARRCNPVFISGQVIKANLKKPLRPDLAG